MTRGGDRLEELDEEGSPDALADRLRLVVARLSIERAGLAPHHQPLPWAQLTHGEQNMWRDHARACQEVAP